MEKIFIGVSTTGEGRDTRICDIAAVDANGIPIFHTLINPEARITQAATNRHGLTNLLCARAPTMRQIEIWIMNVVKGRYVIVWCKPGILPLLSGFVLPAAASIECCQYRFSRHCGEFLKADTPDAILEIKTLEEAMKKFSIPWDGSRHRALPRAQITRIAWEFLDLYSAPYA